MEAILGEGVPWNIIMFFFSLGIFYGMKNGKEALDKDYFPHIPEEMKDKIMGDK